MKKIAPKILPGFMELLPEEQIIFNQMKDIIRKNYEKFGFLPIDSPIIQTQEVLLAKAGGETEAQVYLFKKGDNQIGLRFDLTVPTARYISANYNQLTFPMKCYQIGKSYRGERPQRGRFREFYQCDIDIIGKESLDIVYDAEIPSIMYGIIKEFNIGDFAINISNRKLLAGLIESINAKGFSADILKFVDKFDKIGAEQVEKCLLEEAKLPVNITKVIMNFILMQGNNDEKIEKLKEMNIMNDTFQEGINELEQVVHYLRLFGVPEENFVINFCIIRGLDYYTGTVYETFLKGNESLGSICSGGRYDNLTAHYIDQKLPGVGMSIGLTRLFHTLRENDLLKEKFAKSISQAVVLPMEKVFEKNAIEISNILRNAGIKTETYFEQGKFKNKISYADKRKIPYAIIIGEDEVKDSVVTIKDLQKFEQKTCTIEDAIKIIKNK